MIFQPVADNLRESFRVVASSRPGGEVRELPGVSIASANVAFQMFNAAFLSEPVATEAELARRVHLASLHFGDRGREWSYWICEDFLEPRVRRRSRSFVERQGLRFSTELPGMTADRIQPPRAPLPVLDIQRVATRATREAFCQIGSVCFHVPILWFREVFENPDVWKRFVSFVAYVGGEPVATASVVEGGGVLGVYNVATLPEYQRRGYGECVMRHAIAQFAASPVILQSTPAGLRLYQRMGFRRVATVAVYAS
ncbi:MAG: GNAT family N-acetyltransferase [Acidobacteria bacterium]|nr:GNAT family N-acetyltransferase [Acidobacteriota bacterium]